MSEDMTHDTAREALEALALDALDASEREGVMAHVAGCDECQRELAALESTASELALAAPALPMAPQRRDRIRARLLARAGADRAMTERAFADVRAETSPLAPPSGVIPLRRSRRRMDASTWMAMAAGLVAIIGMGAFM